ncbi:histidine kinase [Streptomyces sp. CB02923]|uniref:GAF domain-containing protein n=1 Tax=Streptomyces sp. CB02923 TaxID=1718985 RepID=UPI00093D333B|nr:GAF domain-containing protein [Streptomyces sp. CB02923]OKI06304.1 histidine kinase [Streptomyces sp. CB02923]
MPHHPHLHGPTEPMGPAGGPDHPLPRLPELLEAMVAVGAEPDPNGAMHRVAEAAASLTSARYAAVGILGEDGDTLADLVTYGVSPEDRHRIGRLPGSRSRILGALLHGTEAVRSADVTRDPRACGPLPPGHPPIRSFLGVPIRADGERFGTLFLADKRDGGEFHAGDLHLVRVLATKAAIALGNTRMHATARQRRRWVDGAASVTTALLAGPANGPTAEDPLTVVAERGRELAEAATAAVLLPHSTGGMEVAALSTVLPDPARDEAYQGVIPSESPVVHQIRAGLAVHSDDFAADPRSVSPLSRHYGPAMLLPLRSGGRVMGALALCRASGGPRFTPAERTLAAQFAAQGALALVITGTRHDRARLAVYEDRDRIARDLHDLVIQRLFATGMLLAGARRGTAVPAVREGVDKALDELDATVQEIRTAIIALQQGPTGTPAGLRARVLEETGAASAQLGTRPSVRFVGPVDARVGEASGDALVEELRSALAGLIERRGTPGRDRTGATDDAGTVDAGTTDARTADVVAVDVVVDAVAVLENGQAGVRLTVTEDGDEVVVREEPL